MQIKISRDYSVSFTDEEVVDALCYLLSHFRSTTETTQVCSLIRNCKDDIRVKHKEGGVALEFRYADEVEYES